MTFFEMRSLVLGSFVGWLTLVGCSGQNVVAGEGKSKTEQLQSSLPGWCSSVCNLLAMCEVDEKVDDDCPEDCQEEMARWTVGNDRCAEAGARFQRCVDEQGCAVRTQEGLCSVSEDEQACPRPGDRDPTNTGGPNGMDGGAGNVPTAPVICGGDSFGAGGGTGASYPVLLCERGHQACSDGHDYHWYCVRTSETVASCACSVDEAVVGAFDPGERCPSTQQVNQGCGWNLDLDVE